MQPITRDERCIFSKRICRVSYHIKALPMQEIPRSRQGACESRRENSGDGPQNDENSQANGNVQIELNGGQVADEDDDGELGAAHADNEEYVRGILRLDMTIFLYQ